MYSTLRAASRRDLCYALPLAVLCVLCADFYLWGGAGIAAAAANVLLWLCALLYLRPHRRRMSGFGLFCLVAYPFAAGCMAFTVSEGSKFLLVLCLCLLSAQALLELMGLRAGTPPCDPASLPRHPSADLPAVCFALPFGSIGRTCYALFHRAAPDGSVQRRRAGSILLGLACALPVLLVVVPLLRSSDAAFEGLLRRLDFSSASELLLALLLGLFAFLLVFGRLFGAQAYLPPARSPETGRGMEPAILIAFLGTLCAVYVLYLLTQLAYFFSAFAGLLPEGFSLAAYARRGFFEMAAICAINLALLLGVHALSRKREGHLPTALRLLSVFVCAFSLLLIATALSKMLLYIRQYGLTRARLETSIFMLFLTILFIALLARLFWRRLPWGKVAVVAGTVLLLLSGFAGIDRTVADYNVHAWQSGRLETIDVSHLSRLHEDAAVPALLELLDASDPAVAQEAQTQLSTLLLRSYTPGRSADGTLTLTPTDSDWRAFTIPQLYARQLLRQNAQRLLADTALYAEETHREMQQHFPVFFQYSRITALTFPRIRAKRPSMGA